MSNEIVLDCPFGDERRTVSIISVTAGKWDMYHVYIDRFYNGRVWLTEHYGWRHDFNAKSELDTADIHIIIEMLVGHSDYEFYF